MEVTELEYYILLSNPSQYRFGRILQFREFGVEDNAASPPFFNRFTVTSFLRHFEVFSGVRVFSNSLLQNLSVAVETTGVVLLVDISRDIPRVYQ